MTYNKVSIVRYIVYSLSVGLSSSCFLLGVIMLLISLINNFHDTTANKLSVLLGIGCVLGLLCITLCVILSYISKKRALWRINHFIPTKVYLENHRITNFQKYLELLIDKATYYSHDGTGVILDDIPRTTLNRFEKYAKKFYFKNSRQFKRIRVYLYPKRDNNKNMVQIAKRNGKPEVDVYLTLNMNKRSDWTVRDVLKKELL